MSSLESISTIKDLTRTETILPVGSFLGRVITYTPSYLLLPAVFIVGMIAGVILHKLYRDSQSSRSTPTNQESSLPQKLIPSVRNQPENKFLDINPKRVLESPSKIRKRENDLKKKTVGIAKVLDYTSTLDKWIKAANEGNIEAYFEIGYMYEHGEDGVEIDLNEALKNYKIGAEKGDTQAQVQVASMYENGEGVEIDLYEAFKYYTMAAQNGSEGAKYQLQQPQFAPYRSKKAPS